MINDILWWNTVLKLKVYTSVTFLLFPLKAIVELQRGKKILKNSVIQIIADLIANSTCDSSFFKQNVSVWKNCLTVECFADWKDIKEENKSEIPH